MKIIVTKNYEDMSLKASNLIINKINSKNKFVIGLATGNTPLKTYKNLIKEYKKNKVSFKNVISFNLDEYVGLKPTHNQSYSYYMNNNLFNHIDINKKNTFIPLGVGNIEKNSQDFEKKIKLFGPIDLQILGIGTNAHIGFNEPGSSEDSQTQEVKLSLSTIKSNQKFFNNKNNIPKKAISMGIGTIMKANLIILLASGKIKAKAIKDTIERKITKKVPASYLQKHKNVIIIVDKDAASLLKKQ
jgi:glucosamine-6-phosphate deaminase